MARVTVEDCITEIPNRFELVVIAASRAKQIASGSPLTLDRDNDKDAVVSLREIAEKTIDINQTRENILQSFCKKQPFARKEVEEENSEIEEMLAEEGAYDSEDAAKYLSIGTPSKHGLSFEEENIDVED